MDRHPYVFRSDPSNPPSLYHLSAARLLARWNPREAVTTKRRFPNLDTKITLVRAKRQLTKYFGLLNDLIKADLLELLFNYKWDSYRQKHRTILDKDMIENDLCCTYPEECSGRHNLDLRVSHLEQVLVWQILVGKTPTNLNMLHWLDQYHSRMLQQEMMITHQLSSFDHMILSIGQQADKNINVTRDVERELVKNIKMVANVQQVQFFATYRGCNAPTWSTVLTSMPRLQSLELHFWTGECFFDIIKDTCEGLRELILSRQRQGRATKDYEKLPGLVSALATSLRVLIIDSVDVNIPAKEARELQRAVSECRHLECLKLEAEESPWVHFHNSRYKIATKRLILSVRKSYQYLAIVRNVNRCVENGVKIQLTFDTYVDIDNHKHAFFSHGPIIGGGENTVAQSTKDFEQKEVSASFHKLMAEFGPKVVELQSETDIRPEYLAILFPNLESVELFARASRKLDMDARFATDKANIWQKMTKFTLEVDPGFSSSCNEFLLVHHLSDILSFAPNIKSVKVLASQAGLKVAEYSLLLALNKLREKVTNLEEVGILSPYKMHGQGITHQTAMWFITNCPKLR